jgi:hypothetical protein
MTGFYQAIENIAISEFGRESLSSLSAGATPKSIPDRDAIGTNRPRSILKWRLKRVGDDLDRRFQGLDPLLSITGVGILFRMAEQISFHILFDGGRAIRQAGVPHEEVAVCR